MAAEGMQSEAQAEALLAAMEQKLKKGPGEALSVDVFASPQDARQAFLALTKVYHPNRFARFSSATQRRANTVFVAIKRAHDDFTRAGRPSGNLPPDRPSNLDLGRPSGVGIARPSLAKMQEAAGTPARAATSAPPPEVAAVARSRRPSAVPQWLPQGATRARTTSSNPGAGPGSPARPTAPAVAPGTTRAAPGLSAPAQPPAGRSSGTSRAMDPAPPLATAKPVAQKTPEELKFDEAKLAMNQQRWADADTLLGQLAVDQPQEKKFRMFRHYVRGRLAQDENRISDARQEYERALNLDATFASARIALGQLPAGGFLGRLFKR